ncbi:MAG TPA: D-aminoacyl-tRNA deacylase [Spirochaetota bacterium]|nr:D-aminoacyl-tRNA deacylase [Spirochaetota bacterium]HPI87729.1 D-aminoacyl-tRNA deacylase [Spirochaetota bacterium]HPR48146.1 D-aminoacyl-tRNA deacylase [Spirochaetota bacterium]
MRAVVQRVSRASVSVNENEVGSINTGLMVLLGLYKDDTDRDTDYIINKILGLRIFDDENGVMNRSIEDISGELLIISQFTLYGDARKGKRPSYSDAMPPLEAEEFYRSFLDTLKKRYVNVAEGIFGADMHVSLVNNGPVTILLDSSRLF